MITRRKFIAAMKKNGFTYSPKTRLLHKDGFNDNPGLEVIMYIRVATAFNSKEYVTFWVQEKFGMEFHPGIKTGAQTFDLVPFDHVMLQLALIKDMQNWWFT